MVEHGVEGGGRGQDGHWGDGGALESRVITSVPLSAMSTGTSTASHTHGEGASKSCRTQVTTPRSSCDNLVLGVADPRMTVH